MPSDRKIVFIGNCQASALAQVYQQFVTPVTGDSVRVVSVDWPVRGDTEILGQADIVVSQVFSMPKPITASGMRPGALKVEFPETCICFLWPFAGSHHIKSRTFPLFGHPPYDAQIGDTFLNQLIVEGVTPEEALDRYLELDIARVANLDQLFEQQLEEQKARDQATGFEFAQIIAAHYQDRCLFLTSHHPAPPLFNMLIRGVFERIDVPLHLIDIAVLAQRAPLLAHNAAPIHPGVIRHFDLRFVNENTKYRYQNEGSFTFKEYVLRYMRHDWNPALVMGMHLANSDPDIDKAHTLLNRAVEVSPGSAAGWRARSKVFRRMCRPAEAHAAATAAIAIDPMDCESHIELAHVLREQNDLAGAEAAARRAIACFCADGLGYLVLAEILAAAGNTGKATEAAQRAAALRPGDAHAHLLLGKLLVVNEDWNGAEDAYRQAILLDPDHIEVKFFLAQVLYQQHRDVEALDLAHEVLSSGLKNPHVHALLGHIYARDAELERAEAAFRAALAGDPSFAPFEEALSSVIARRQNANSMGASH